MLWRAIASFLLVLIMAILVGLGFWHARRTPPEAEPLTPKTRTSSGPAGAIQPFDG
jgi:cytochrome oxidase assembly protein ShyY1